MGDGGTHRCVLTTTNDDKHVVVCRLVAMSLMVTWDLDVVLVMYMGGR